MRKSAVTISRTKRGRAFAGVRPRGKGWGDVGKVGPWEVWVQGGGEGWVNVKLVLEPERRAAKANFSLAFDGERWAEGRDLAVLKDRNAWLWNRLRRHYSGALRRMLRAQKGGSMGPGTGARGTWCLWRIGIWQECRDGKSRLR